MWMVSNGSFVGGGEEEVEGEVVGDKEGLVWLLLVGLGSLPTSSDAILSVNSSLYLRILSW